MLGWKGTGTLHRTPPPPLLSYKVVFFSFYDIIVCTMYIYVGEEAVAVEGMKNKMKRNLNNARDRVNYLCELTGCPCSSSNTSYT